MAFLEYVQIAKHVGLNQTRQLLDRLRELDRPGNRAAADVLRRHHLIDLIFAMVPAEAQETALSSAFLDRLRSKRPSQRAPLEELLIAYDEMAAAYGRNGVPFLLLKGFYFADRLYGGLGRRPQQDLDILVRREDFEKGLQTLTDLGFLPSDQCLHATTVERGRIKIDVHWCLRNRPAFRLDEGRIWARAREYTIVQRRFETLSDDDTIVLLSLSLFEDIGWGKGKIKQVLDLYLLLRSIDSNMDWSRFLADRKQENLLAVCTSILALTIEIFHAKDEIVNLHEALAEHRSMVRHSRSVCVLELFERPKGHIENEIWFWRIYPGSLLYYCLWYWQRDFAGNLRKSSFDTLRASVRVAIVALRRYA